MKIYDDAHKLAKQIRESKEYKEYKELKENIESNPVKKAQVEEFEHLRYRNSSRNYARKRKCY